MRKQSYKKIKAAQWLLRQIKNCDAILCRYAGDWKTVLLSLFSFWAGYILAEQLLC